MNLMKKYSMYIGIFAMVLLVAGTISQGGSLVQKLLFLFGVPFLGLSAYLNKQKMFTVLQTVVTIATIVAFFQSIPDILRYLVMLGSGLLGIAYLIKINYFKEDVWWSIAGLGLMSIAAGFATNPVIYPVLFNSFLAAGGILVTFYSGIGFFHSKVRTSIIWLILNILFAANPLIIISHSFGFL